MIGLSYHAGGDQAGGALTWLEHLPVLQVLLPLGFAPLCLLARRARLAAPLAIAACWGTFAIALKLLATVLAGDPLSYELGGWEPPFGIEYRIDVVSAFVATFVSGIGALVASYAPRSLSIEVPPGQLHRFWTLYLLALAGLLGIVVTGDLFNVFVFLEVSALSSYALISLGRDRRALTASYQYLIMGSLGATFILIGIGLLYMMTGTLNMADMALRVAKVETTRTVQAAFGFLTVGICLKSALFPLHLWLPNAYTFAPSVVTAFLAATSTKVSIYVLLRFFLGVFGPEFALRDMPLEWLLLGMSLVAIVSASVVAVFQTNLKRVLAYSSVAQVGYMVLGISLANVEGLTGALVHLFNHALTKCALFMAAGCFFLRVGSVHVDDLRGIGKRMPLTTAALVVGGLGLIGVPGTAGFVSKFYLVLGALQSGVWPVAIVILASSLIAVAYVWRLVEIAYFERPPEGSPPPGGLFAGEAPLSMLVPLWLVAGASLWFGVFTAGSAGVASRAAAVLLGVAK